MAGFYLKLFSELKTASEAGRVKVIFKPGVTVTTLNNWDIGDPMRRLQLFVKRKQVQFKPQVETLLCRRFSVLTMYQLVNRKLDGQQENETWIKVTKSVTFKSTWNIQN